MTADRSRAYAHVMNVVADFAPAKLHAEEQAAIRDAADALLFCNDMSVDTDAREALTRLEDLFERMVAADRLLPETSERILEAVEGCGPEPVAA
jgi:hypothetical protein